MASSDHMNGCTTSPTFYRAPELNMMGLIDSSAVDAATTVLKLEMSQAVDHADLSTMLNQQAAAAYWPGATSHGQQLILPQESLGCLYNSPAPPAAAAPPAPSRNIYMHATTHDASQAAGQLRFPGCSYKTVSNSHADIFPFKNEQDLQVDTTGHYNLNFPYKSCGNSLEQGSENSPQLQALRDFMSYGPSCSGGQQQQQQPNSPGGRGSPNSSSQPLFLQLGEEPSTSFVSPHAHDQLITGNCGNFQQQQQELVVGCKQDVMASYRALCQAEMFAATGGTQILERSPHRSQFQRENHIMAERQRREEMNEKFTALRSMIPKATKKDKASIVGDTISYVLELEKTLKHLQACKAARKGGVGVGVGVPFIPPTHKQTHTAVPSKKKVAGAAASSTSAFPHASHDQDQSTASDRSQLLAHEEHSSSLDNCNLLQVVACNHQLGSMSKQFNSGAGAVHHPKFYQPVDSAGPAISSPSDHLEDDAKHIKDTGGEEAQVEVQKLRDQAVIKIICTRSPGLVFRILHALDECNVDLLQGNVTTVDENTVHLITVQLIAGMSASTEDLVVALQNASTAIT